MINKEFLNGCKGVVMNCDCSILVVELFGEVRAYLTPVVNLKTRECRYNEAIDAQDITKLIDNVAINFATGMTNQKLREQVQSIHKENFKFGTDNYIWITKVDLNR